MKPLPLNPLTAKALRALKKGGEGYRFYSLLFSASFRIVLCPRYPRELDPLLF